MEEKIKAIIKNSFTDLSMQPAHKSVNLISQQLLTLIKEWGEEIIGGFVDDDFGFGSITINGHKYLLEEGSKEFRMLKDLIEEQTKRMATSLSKKK